MMVISVVYFQVAVIQLLGCVRWKISDPQNQDMEAIQKCLNKLLRALNGSKLSEKISTKSMLKKFNMLSVNQMNAQIKLLEMWKSVNIINYPIKTSPVKRNDNFVNTRAVSNGVLQEKSITNHSQRTFLNDAIHIWNLSPSELKSCTSIFSAKKSIKEFVKTLPL